MRLPAVALALVSVLHLSGQLAGSRPVAETTQVLLMPSLAWLLLTSTTAPRSREVRLALLALGLSWLGDSAPRLTSGELSFLLMVGFFLLAQLVYVAAFRPFWRTSVLRRPLAVLPYVAVATVITAVCAPGAGTLLPAIALYALAIAAMAVLATGLGRVAGVGGALFVVSDALIALDAFAVLTLPGQGFWVMSTYISAQTLLIRAVRRRARTDPAPR